MKELIAEYDCFISSESSNKLQLLNHSRINKYDGCEIVNAQYKHKIPNLQMTIVHNGYESNCKSTSVNTETKLVTEVNDVDKDKSNFIIYFTGHDAHLVPLSRPILSSYIVNENIPEYKKHQKEKQKQDYNPLTETKISLEKFHEVSKDKKFNYLSDIEKTRQPWIPVKIQSINNNPDEIRQSLLVCYKKEELPQLETSKSNHMLQVIPSRPAWIRKSDEQINMARSHSSMESEILNILVENQVIRLKKLMELLRDRHRVDRNLLTEKVVLNQLTSLALCIRGHWVLKSDVFYRISPSDGVIPSERLCLARDYILTVFYTGENLTTKAVQSKTKMPSATVTELLNQLAKRDIDSKGGMWKFPEHDYEFIWKHDEINKHQIELMDQKVKEVWSKLKLNNVPKRVRTFSSQVDYKSEMKRPRDLSPILPSMKRLRQNSTPLNYHESVSLESMGTHEPVPVSAAVWAQVPEKLTRINEELTERGLEEFMQISQTRIKGEPYLSPCPSPIREDDFSNIKAEASEFYSDKDDDNENYVQQNPFNQEQPMETNFPIGFPSQVVFNDLKLFIKTQLNVLEILPTTTLASTYHETHLSKLSVGDIDHWALLTGPELIETITNCINKILDELGAQKIDITWPQVNTALPQQQLYFSNKDSMKNDKVIIDIICELLKAHGKFVISDIKKMLVTSMEQKLFFHTNDNMLRDRLKKYCLFVNRKYYLKHTISDKK